LACEATFANAVDCVIAALEGYLKASKALPRQGASQTGRDRAVLPSLVTAKLAVYETMRTRGWSKLKLAKMLGMSENSVRRLLDLRHGSHMWIIAEALSKMNAELRTTCRNHDRAARRREGCLHLSNDLTTHEQASVRVLC
jgi:antitoxin HicB